MSRSVVSQARSVAGLSGRRHAMVVHAYYPLGETRVQREAAALVEAGMTVDVICLRDGGEPRSETVDGVDVRRLPIGRNRHRGILYQLVEYLAFLLAAGGLLSVRHLRSRYHSVQAHNLPDFLVFAALVPKLTGAHVLLDLHDLMPEFLAARLGRSMDHPLVRAAALQERMSCRFADSVLTVTEGWRRRLIGRGVAPHKVSVVMNVADPALFRPRESEPDPDTFTVVYHGTFSHRYGVDLLVDAAAALRTRISSLRVWLLGDGEYRPEIEAAVQRLGLDDVVEVSDGMLGVSELRKYLDRADVGVVPNRSSVFTDDLLPTKLIEYVAVGVPVVASRTPMIESYFDDRMVEFFSPGDVRDLVEKLTGLAESSQRRRERVSAASEFVERHSWESVSKEYLTAVAGDGTLPPGRSPSKSPVRARRVRGDEAGGRHSGQLEVVWSDEPADGAWDDFVAAHPLGHHTQAAMWAEVKAAAGWQTARLVLRRSGRIVGGAQILYRNLAWRVAAGYVSKGPLLASEETSLLPEVLEEIEARVRLLHLRHVTIQPVDEELAALAPSRGYLLGTAQVTPPATVLVDLDRPIEDVLAAMSSKTRYNIRVSGRKGISVRVGDVSDIDTYYRLYRQTAGRQGFEPTDISYFRRMWEVMGPRGHIRLALAEFDGEPVSGQIAVAFGDTVVNKMAVWSGREGSRRPNEALQWATMEWAHGAGFHSYDLEGLPRKVAETVRDTGQLPPDQRQTVSSYKLGFGGRVVLFPLPYDYIPSRPVRWLYSRVTDRLDRKQMKRVIEKVRVRNR